MSDEPTPLVVAGSGKDGPWLVCMTADEHWVVADPYTTLMLAGNQDFVYRLLDDGRLLVYDQRGIRWIKHFRLKRHPVALCADESLRLLLGHKLLHCDRTGQSFEHITLPSRFRPECLAHHSNGQIVVGKGSGGRLRLWNGNTTQAVGVWDGDPVAAWKDEDELYLLGADPHRAACLKGETLTWEQQLPGMPKCLVLLAAELFIGGERPADEPASLAVLDKHTGELLGDVPVPGVHGSVLAITTASRALLDGVRAGLQTNPYRVRQRVQRECFARAGVEPLRLWATGEELPDEACSASLQLDVPPVLEAGRKLVSRLSICNRAGVILVGVPPCPVTVSARWLDGDQLVAQEELPLPKPAFPGTPLDIPLPLQVPDVCGSYRLELSLAQGHRRFSDLNPDSGLVLEVEVAKS